MLRTTKVKAITPKSNRKTRKKFENWLMLADPFASSGCPNPTRSYARQETRRFIINAIQGKGF